ncbi:hypothetical protein [Vulcanisaeta sp. JCM 16159]|uniref:hypothetical protein n=1 Tax=Vulcanisaeta sp. JCM 16159 TaxID=1295371 RepID=UPI000AACC7E3|nr:hypothetical protein [Vulcanisaeta sp. JCM 16159]
MREFTYRSRDGDVKVLININHARPWKGLLGITRDALRMSRGVSSIGLRLPVQ